MKTILRVAKTELKLLFYSPIAWFLLIVFLIQCGLVYLGLLQSISRMQEMTNGNSFIQSATNFIFLSRSGLFGNVMQNLYLYVPLLTMSLISRETSSGTIKLLYSSPVKVREIVLGKYLSMVIYSLLLVLVVAVFVVSGLFHIQNAETGMLMAGLLGFFLLLCAYSAIGLFMSCLTTYQVVAAICTFVMIGILSYIGTLWQRIAFVRELTYFLSINGRTQKMLAGLITTKDLVYFVVIVYIFLGLSIMKLRAGMESKPAIVKAGRYVAIVASALLVGYVFSLPALTGYYDATFNKSRTLTPQVQKILANFGDEPLEVTAYVNLLDQYGYLGGPESYNENIARWENYIRFKPDIKLKSYSYYDSAKNSYLFRGNPGKSLKEVAEQYAKGMDVKLSSYMTPAEMRKIKDLRSEDNRYVMELKWKGKSTMLRVFDDQQVWPGETEVAAAFMRLQQAKLPKIAFAAGDLERDIDKTGDRDFKALANMTTFRNSLVNQGFDVQTVYLDTDDIPSDISALVLADPRLELPAAALARLQQYIDKGGNLLIAGEPGRQAILNPLLARLGVQMMEGTLVQQNKDDAPNFIKPLATPFTTDFYKPMKRLVDDSIDVAMPGAAALTYTDSGMFAIHPLLLTNNKSWNRRKPLDMEMMVNADAGTDGIQVSGSAGAVGAVFVSDAPADRRRSRAQMGTVSFSAADGDIKGPLPTALSLTRKINNKEQRIVVAGDADFMSNKESARPGKGNFIFSTSLFRWMSNGEYPVDTFRPEPRDKKVNLTLDGIDTLRIIYIWVVPAILLAFATVLLIRRKRK